MKKGEMFINNFEFFESLNNTMLTKQPALPRI